MSNVQLKKNPIFFAWKFNFSDLSGYQADLDIEKDRNEKAAIIQNQKK